jgi:hypothetical protein
MSSKSEGIANRNSLHLLVAEQTPADSSMPGEVHFLERQFVERLSCKLDWFLSLGIASK